MKDSNNPPNFGALQLPAIEARLQLDGRTAPLGPPDELVLFTVRLKRGEILRLKEAAYYLPAFREQAFVQQAITAALDALGDQIKPLPDLILDDLVRKNKKLQG